jgi:hypothetical protein
MPLNAVYRKKILENASPDCTLKLGSGGIDLTSEVRIVAISALT